MIIHDPSPKRFLPETLGSQEFQNMYGLKYNYVAGSMYKAIASKELVVRMGQARLLSFLGSGGLSLAQIEEDIKYIKAELGKNKPYGVNLLYQPANSNKEEEIVELFIKHRVSIVEASAFMNISINLVRYRLYGIYRNNEGVIVTPNSIIAKVSRPEIARLFIQPPPTSFLNTLVSLGKITPEQAELGTKIPLAQTLCVEADSGGHTDQGASFVLIPSIIRLSNKLTKQYNYSQPIQVGVAGGIGTPESIASAFLMGAAFIVTGSINQCTQEAGTSDKVKDILQTIDIQDTAYAPAGDMFELGAKIQVVKKGLLFPARANKLYELYKQYNSLEEIDKKTTNLIQEKYFKRSFDEVWEETKIHYQQCDPKIIEEAQQNPKRKIALIFRWYFIHTNRLALTGNQEQVVDYQIHCGSALGAFNQLVYGTELENWRNRHVDVIAKKLMHDAANILDKFYNELSKRN